MNKKQIAESEDALEKKEQIVIFDTTLRDGEQWAGGALKHREKVAIAHQLAIAKVDVIEAGFAASSRRDFESIETIAKEVKGPVIASLARTNERDIERAAEALRHAERPCIHVFIATSDDHMRDKLMMSPDRVLETIDRTVRFAKTCVGDRGYVEWSGEDASRSSLAFLAKAVRVAIDAGATTINLPDTVGFDSPSKYGYLFRSVISAVKPEPHIIFSAHVHNDRDHATANSLAAIESGARQVECTIRGVGERAGNASLERVVANIKIDDVFASKVDTRQLTPLANLHASFIPDISCMQPIVGSGVFAHGSGIHQNGMVKGGLYEYMDKRNYGHAEGNNFPLTVHSGKAGVESGLINEGIRMSGQELDGFMEMFKKYAAAVLDKHDERIVSPKRLVKWSQQYLADLKVA